MSRGVERILVIGSPGSGKTVFARALAQRTGLPLEHLDDHYWWEGWRRTPEPQWRAVVADLAAAPRWIIDGNYAPTLEQRLARADAIVLFDLHPLTCLRGLAARTLRIARGHPEQLPRRVREGPLPLPAASGDLLELVALTVGFRRRTRPAMLRQIDRAAPAAWLLAIRRRGDAQAVLRALEAAVVATRREGPDGVATTAAS